MVSMSRRKVQTALLLDPPVRDRADILAASMGVVRAEVLRRALEGSGLKGLEKDYAEPRAQLIAAAGRLRMTTVELARSMERDRILMADLEGHDSYHDALAASPNRRRTGGAFAPAVAVRRA